MKDQRVAYYRGVLDALLESLDATVRISRWKDADGVPDPLQQSAAKLVERLGAANRLASCKVVGVSRVVTSLTGISSAIQHLDAAYVQYRHRIDEMPTERDEAAVALDTEISGVKAEARRLTSIPE
jgi:hypothetical protein